MADWLEGFVPMKLHVLIRFGRWRDIIATPLPADPGALLRHDRNDPLCKGRRSCGSGQRGGGRRGGSPLRGGLAQVPPSRYVFNNTCLDILAIAAEMMKGEIEYRKGQHRSSPLPIFASRSNSTTIYPMTSLGRGCSRRVMRWERCCWSRAA